MRLKSLKNIYFLPFYKGETIDSKLFLLSLQRVFSLTQREKK